MSRESKKAEAPLLENLILYGSPKYTDPKDWAICRLFWQGEGHIVVEYQDRSYNTYLQLSTDDHLVASGTRDYLRTFQQQAIEKLSAETARCKSAEVELHAATDARIKAFDLLLKSIQQGTADIVCPKNDEATV